MSTPETTGQTVERHAREDRAARVRLTDKRLLIIFTVVMIIFGGAATIIKRQVDQLDNATALLNDFRVAIVSTCLSNQRNTRSFNTFITQIQYTTATSPLLTYQERKDRVVFYQAGKQPVPACPAPKGPLKPGDETPPPPAPPVRP